MLKIPELGFKGRINCSIASSPSFLLALRSRAVKGVDHGRRRFEINVVSGIGVAEHSKSAFLELKRKRVHRYLIFKISEKKNEVLVKKTGGPAENYDDFAESLPRNDCQYAI
ncbi:UNVERIFIED_CONTAM: Actin-depolymerizing factor [Sesamum radiatum]|uniref:Actin-depolymerizing factor n=1 Tax=Sesamum radiatum TaxID=300843 RepID=A0AAW2URB1_SESRA